MLRFSPSRLPSAPVGSGVHGDPDKVRAFLEVVLDRDTARVTAVDVGGGASSWFGMPLSVRNGDGGVLEGAGRLKACVPADGGRSGSGGGGESELSIDTEKQQETDKTRDKGWQGKKTATT